MKSHRNIQAESFKRAYPESVIYLEACQQRVKDDRKRKKKKPQLEMPGHFCLFMSLFSENQSNHYEPLSITLKMLHVHHSYGFAKVNLFRRFTKDYLPNLISMSLWKNNFQFSIVEVQSKSLWKFHSCDFGNAVFPHSGNRCREKNSTSGSRYLYHISLGDGMWLRETRREREIQVM